MSVTALAELVGEAGSCVVLTGAGVSTESGIPDFRSASGIWAQYDPMEYASIQAFRRDPEKVWDFYSKRLAMLAGAEPNAAHVALAELERLGYVRAIITQNIDTLHTRAGSGDVIEVHGSIRTASCPGCGASYPLEEVTRLVDEGGGVPRCPACGRIVKPDVVMFGELLPETAIDRAFELARATPLLLVVGSALEVYPVAGLPLETIVRGGRFVVVNRGPTALDSRASLVVDGSAGEILSGVVDELRRRRAWE